MGMERVRPDERPMKRLVSLAHLVRPNRFGSSFQAGACFGKLFLSRVRARQRERQSDVFTLYARVGVRVRSNGHRPCLAAFQAKHNHAAVSLTRLKLIKKRKKNHTCVKNNTQPTVCSSVSKRDKFATTRSRADFCLRAIVIQLEMTWNSIESGNSSLSFNSFAFQFDRKNGLQMVKGDQKDGEKKRDSVGWVKPILPIKIVRPFQSRSVAVRRKSRSMCRRLRRSATRRCPSAHIFRSGATNTTPATIVHVAPHWTVWSPLPVDRSAGETMHGSRAETDAADRSKIRPAAGKSEPVRANVRLDAMPR